MSLQTLKKTSRFRFINCDKYNKGYCIIPHAAQILLRENNAFKVVFSDSKVSLNWLLVAFSQVWFQNRRAKWRKREKAKDGEDGQKDSDNNEETEANEEKRETDGEERELSGDMVIKREKDSVEHEGQDTGNGEKSEDEYRQEDTRKPVKEEFPAQCGRFKGCAGHAYSDKEHSSRDFDYFEKIRTSSIAALRRRAKEHEVLLTSQNSVIWD